MKNTALHNYCLKLLKEFGCERDTYRWTPEDESMYGDSLGNLDTHIAETVCDLFKCAYGVPSENIERDDKICKWIFENPRWGAITIVTELYAIGNAVKPPKKDKYSVVWNTDSCCDGYEVGNNLKGAKESAIECLCNWIDSFSDGPKTREDWDSMISECYANVHLTKDADNCDSESSPVWEPSSKDLQDIGWVASDEMSDEMYNEYVKAYGWPKRK